MKTKFVFLISLIFLLTISSLKAQYVLQGEELHDPVRVSNAVMLPAEIDGVDTNLIVVVRKVTIMPPYKFKNKRQKRKYNRLAYHIKKVYPYAVEIRNTYAEVEANLVNFETRKEQKRYLKTKEKELRNEFEKDLINLTFYQGRLLIKLVDRETGSTTYDVVKEFKGGMSAFFWQSVAVMFGANLKSQYDKEEDRMIEDIIVRIENGQL